MPKGKKKGKKKGKEKKAGEAKGDDSKEQKPPNAFERELVLKQELDDLNLELVTLKKQVEDLRKENEWLQDEAERTKHESQDYQTYVSRKAQKRQSLIVSLNDQNALDLREIKQQREELLRDYEEKKTGLNATLLEKENELSTVHKDLKTLERYKLLQREQEHEVAALEWQLEELRFRHEDQVRSLKTSFLREKKALEGTAQARLRAMANSASKQASECLQEHVQRVGVENVRLRAELQQLMATTSDLQLQKGRLEQQHRALLREERLGQELQRVGRAPGGVFRRRLEPPVGEAVEEFEGRTSLPEIRMPYSSSR